MKLEKLTDVKFVAETERLSADLDSVEFVLES